MGFGRRMGTAALLAVGLTAACARAPAVIGTQPSPHVSGDAVIAGTVSTANEGEIAQARIAVERATHPDVRAFAQRMIREHGTAAEQLQRVLAKMGAQEAGSTFATSIEENGARTAELLRAIDAAHFDRTYMASQITLHEWLLRTLDDTLIPSARDDALEAQLRMLRASVVDHLDRARRIQERLGSGS